MGDRVSTRERPSNASLWGAAISLTPIVFAAVLAGCSTKAQTRGAAQTTPPVQASPPAAQAAVAPEAPVEPAQAEAEAVAPTAAFQDEGGGAVPEDAVAPETFADEAPAPVPEEATPQHFSDSTAPAPEEEPLPQQPFVDEQQAQDESSVAPERFVDEAPAMDQDSIPPQRFTDDEALAPDESVATPERFRDDAVAAREEASPPPVFKDETAEAAPEESAPAQTFTDDNVAQAEPAKPSKATMLPLTISVEADSLFDFDRYAIRPDSRHNLDELAAKLGEVGYGEVIAVGFADPIGTDKYNQRLSEQRAAAVKRYLVSKGIPPDRIKTEGRGRTDGYASYKSCAGLRKQKLIACLQPNRRVEVTVTAQE